MTAEIHKPFGNYLLPTISDDVLDILSETLEAAKRGAVAAVSTRGTRGVAELLGAVVVAQDSIIKRWADD